jgi:cytochrome c556
MRTTLLAAAVSAGLLAGCGQGADDDATGNTAANSVATLPAAGNGTAPVTAASLPTQALAGEDAKKLMHDRHENYERFGDSMKVITRELKGDSPDLAEIRKQAGTYTELGPRMLTWFPPGTGPEAGKTEAKAEIWQKPEDFTAKHQAFTQAASAFATAAAGQDIAAIRAAHGNLGKSCKACHDLYREDDH